MRVPVAAHEVLSSPSPITGAVAAATAAAAFVGDAANDCRDYRSAVQRAGRAISQGRGAALATLRTKMLSRLEPGAQMLVESAHFAKRGFVAYAAEVERIHRSARLVVQSVDDDLATIRSSAATLEGIAEAIDSRVSATWDDPPHPSLPEPAVDASHMSAFDPAEREAASRAMVRAYAPEWRRAAVTWKTAAEGIREAQRRWDALRSEREGAELALMSTLRDTDLGRLIEVSGSAGLSAKQTVALAFSGEVWGRTGAPGVRKTHPLLRTLIGSESGEHVWHDPPNPRHVADGWARLSDDERKRLIAEVPWVIGNLPGVPFGVRDRANRNMIALYAAGPVLLGARSQSALEHLRTLLAQRGTPRASVVSLDLTGEVPLVVMGYGDLDTAEYLTWSVPGMGNDADAALPAWDRVSRNLFQQKQDVLDDEPSGGPVGVMAFLGYDTPDTADSLGENGVLSSTLARAGAKRLAAELDGTWAARNHGLHVQPGFKRHGSPTISVVAHSYGTTTAANALTAVRYEVDSYTMLGSAGLDTGVVTALDELRVVRDHTGQANIFASHAADDRLAPIGLLKSGRANPVPTLMYAHAPNLPGAIGFSSDGYAEANGREFTRTDGHGTIGQSTRGAFDRHTPLIMLGFEASEGHGYFDQGTQSLHNAAAGAANLQHRIVGGVHVGGQ